MWGSCEDKGKPWYDVGGEGEKREKRNVSKRVNNCRNNIDEL